MITKEPLRYWFPELNSLQVDKLRRYIEEEKRLAVKEELNSLYIKSEIIGVGYAIVREEHITDRLKELNDSMDDWGKNDGMDD